ATARLYLVINILQIFILDSMGVPFWVTTVIILIMIILYTFEGGVKTIVFTDTLQTSFMLIGLIVCTIYILSQLCTGDTGATDELRTMGLATILNSDFASPSQFFKHMPGGALITVAMAGLDQEMMQKNISVKNLRDSQTDMMTLSSIMTIVNFM